MPKWRDVKQNRVKENSSNSIPQDENTQSCASLPSRFKAFLTDSFLITTPIIYIVMYLVLGGGDEFSQNRTFGWGLILGISALIIIFFWHVKFQTPGMKAYGIKLVNSKEERVSLLQAFIRYFATLFAIVSLFLLFTPFFNKSKKTFQDIISNTLIIEE